MQKHEVLAREGARSAVAKRPLGPLAALVALMVFLAACSTSTPDAVTVDLVNLSGQVIEDVRHLDGATLTGTVTLAVKENPRFTAVAYYVDDAAMGGAPVHVDDAAPFLAQLDTTTLADGMHELTVAAAVDRGNPPVTTYAFEVRNGQDDQLDPGTGGEDSAEGSYDGSPDDGTGDGWSDPLQGEGDGEEESTEPEFEEPQSDLAPQDPYASLPAPTLFVSTSGSDSNDGRSRSQPLRTITKAGSVARPGDVIEVAAGTYRGGVTTRASGTADARIVYYAETAGSVLLDTSGSYTGWHNDGSYVDIVGFELTGADYLGMYSMGSYVRILHNHVHDLATPSCNGSKGGAGIDHGDYNGRGNETIGNIVHDIVPPGDFCNLIHGIYHANYGGTVQNNIVYNVSANGIQTWHAANAVTITNNLVFGNNIGITIGGSDATAHDYYVANNIVIHNNYGIVENGSIGSGNLYANNLLYGNSTNFVWRGGGDPQGTIFADPRLIDFRTDGSGDYRPTANSPAIDAGVSEGAPETDLVGTPRPQLGAVDLGPYEMPSYDAWALR